MKIAAELLQQPKTVGVMDEMIYNALSGYYHALEMKGYMPDIHARKLLVLSFYRDFVLSDYRGILSKDDYLLIEQALDCLYGTTCLIPYPDYLKMSKLHLGQTTELANRIKVIEETEVLKTTDFSGETGSDVIILEAESD